MKKIIESIKYIIIVVLSVFLILNIYIILASESNPNKVPSVFGYKPFVVLSGSMSPNIQVGDLIFIKNTNTDNLKEKDIIAYKNSSNIITTHRIVAIQYVNGEKCFMTKGDANNVADEKIVCKDKIEGKYVKRIAKLGNVIIFIQQPLGFIIMILTILLIGIIIYLLDNNKKNKKELESFKKMGRLKKEE